MIPKHNSHINSLGNSLLLRFGVFAIISFFAFTLVLSHNHFKNEKHKIVLLAQQISYSLKSSLMIKDEMNVRIMLNRNLEIEGIEGIEIKTKSMPLISDYKQGYDGQSVRLSNFGNYLLGSTFNISSEFALYPSKSEKFSVTVHFKNNLNLSILLSSLGLLLVVMALLFLVFSLRSKVIIHKDEIQRSIDSEKSALASRIFHLIKSNVSQVIELVNDSKGISQNNKILISTELQTIQGTSAKFIKGSSQNSFSLDKYKKVDLSHYLNEFLFLKRLELSKKPKKVNLQHIESKQTAHIVLKTIPKELKHVLSHIIDNSYDAVQDCGDIKIKTHLEKNMLKISIIDDGIGIPEDQIANIFEDGFSYNKQNGNGIGLYQVNEIINALGGDIHLESKLNQGTTVTISLLCESNEFIYRQSEIDAFDSILIDDSKLRRINAVKSAKLKGKNIGVFSGLSEFMPALNSLNIDEEIMIYIDSDLGEELSGEDAAKNLYYDHGFKNICLYTADDIEKFQNKPMPWLKEIISKNDVTRLM